MTVCVEPPWELRGIVARRPGALSRMTKQGGQKETVNKEPRTIIVQYVALKVEQGAQLVDQNGVQLHNPGV